MKAFSELSEFHALEIEQACRTIARMKILGGGPSYQELMGIVAKHEDHYRKSWDMEVEDPVDLPEEMTR